MSLILGAQSASAEAFTIDNSCKFDIASSSYLVKTTGTDSATLATKYTFSLWVKRSHLGDGSEDSQERIFYNNGGTYFQMKFHSDNALWAENYNGATQSKLVTNRLFRDTSAWLHIVYSFDSTPATPSSSSIKLFVNGVQETSFSTETYEPQDAAGNLAVASRVTPIASVDIGSSVFTNFFGGYLAEVVAVDGQALDADSFGEFDEDSPTLWKPIDVSGITLGNYGFYLDFKDSANMGNDVGGGTDFTSTNIDATDQGTDTPTNNFGVLNSLDNYYAGSTFSEGNCKLATTSGAYTWNTGTVGLSAGLWYWEIKVATAVNLNYQLFGVANTTAIGVALGTPAWGWGYNGNDGKIYHDNANTAYGDTFTTDDIIGVYLDLTNSKLYFAKNGVIQNSGTGYSITAVGSTNTGFYFPAAGDFTGISGGIFEFNFGGSPAFTVSSGNTDANGYGNFEYDPSSGTFDGASKDFLAICTKNLGSDGG